MIKDKTPIMKKYIKNLICIILLAVVAVYLVVSAMTQEAAKEEVEQSVTLTPGTATMREIAVCVNGDEKIQISGYERSKGVYYYFLPAYADLTQIQLLCEAEYQLLYQGKLLKSGDTLAGIEANQPVPVALTDGISKVYENAQLIFMKSENIPSMFIQTNSGSMEYVNRNKGNKEDGIMTLITADGKVDSDAAVTVKVRGNATSTFEKKPYHLSLSEEQNLLGMGADTDWVLLANATDYTYMGNVLAYAMAEAAKMPYTPKLAWIDLYLNQEYAGTYLLCEQIKIGTNRVDITNLEEENQKKNPTLDFSLAEGFETENSRGIILEQNPEDITGGYLLERDYRTSREYWNTIKYPPSWFETNGKEPFHMISPEYASAEQVDYISDYIQQVEDALLSEDGYNSETGKYYTEYIHVDSFVKAFLLAEITYDEDKMGTSAFYYKDSDAVDSRLYAGPAWDYDNRWGFDYYTSPNVLSMLSSNGCMWYDSLYDKEEFYTELRKEYSEIFRPFLMDAVDNRIDTYQKEISASVTMDAARWEYTGFQESVQQLKVWILQRVRFLDAQWLS